MVCLKFEKIWNEREGGVKPKENVDRIVSMRCFASIGSESSHYLKAKNVIQLYFTVFEIRQHSNNIQIHSMTSCFAIFLSDKMIKRFHHFRLIFHFINLIPVPSKCEKIEGWESCDVFYLRAANNINKSELRSTHSFMYCLTNLGIFATQKINI